MIHPGDVVHVAYEGSFPDGEIFDQSKDDAPLVVTIGEHRVIPGFENALLGMKVGETKTVHIEAKDGYGDPDPDLTRNFPKDQVPDVPEGSVLGVQLPNGVEIPARVTKVTDSEVTIDLNHPLAGKDLIFKLTIVSVEENKKA